MNGNERILPAEGNQVRGMAEVAGEFLEGGGEGVGEGVRRRTAVFHADSVGCGWSAVAWGANATRVLRGEALEYRHPRKEEGATVFGAEERVRPEKAVAANCAAVREWDANGTNFGYNPRLGNTAGEFGHNDFYPVVMAAAEPLGWDGRKTLRAMVLLDEIRGRLAEVFALRKYKIDHVVHGAVASAVVYGTMWGATVDQVESAVGMVVAHYIPFRAIRAGKQLSDSKGASAALAAETAVMSVQRAMRGFVGPKDVFRNPEALFCLFEPPAGPDRSPFDLTLSTAGDDFAVMGMHFKLGLYEHQSAGAIQGLIDFFGQHPELIDTLDEVEKIQVSIYEPAFSIIGDPAKRDPRSRQSADHSMVFILASLLRKIGESGRSDWADLMLTPEDYSDDALVHPTTRRWIDRIEFRHGGPEFDRRYPDGIPTQTTVWHRTLGELAGPLVMYPMGHARCDSERLAQLLRLKFIRLASCAVADPGGWFDRLLEFEDFTPAEVRSLYSTPIMGR